jgi:hypothetical protein
VASNQRRTGRASTLEYIPGGGKKEKGRLGLERYGEMWENVMYNKEVRGRKYTPCIMFN